MESELQRLKAHLVDMEDQHTSEMLACEDKEKALQSQIHELQQKISFMVHQRYFHFFVFKMILPTFTQKVMYLYKRVFSLTRLM